MALKAAEMPNKPGPVCGNFMSTGVGSSHSQSPRAAKRSHRLSSTWQGHLSQNWHWLTGWRVTPPVPRSPPFTNTREAVFVRKVHGLKTEDRTTMFNMKNIFIIQKLSFKYKGLFENEKHPLQPLQLCLVSCALWKRRRIIPDSLPQITYYACMKLSSFSLTQKRFF